MTATFTDDDLEKTVENETGEVIGTVTAVEDLRTDLEDATEPGSERATALLERQIELLEACRERLDADDGR